MYYCPHCENYVELLKDDICSMCFEDVMSLPEPINIFGDKRKELAYEKAKSCSMTAMWNKKVGELFEKAIKIPIENPQRTEFFRKCAALLAAAFRVTMYNYSRNLEEKQTDDNVDLSYGNFNRSVSNGDG